ncbi:MAG: DUF4199 domain-containing protein [Cytophagaceae bacterium]
MDIRVKFGLFTGALSAVWYLIYYAFLFKIAPFLSVMVWVILLAGIVLGIRYAKVKKYTGQMTFSQGITAGLTITGITAIITSLTNTIYIKIINPGFINTYIIEVKKLMETSGLQPEEMQKQVEAIEKTFTTTSLLMSGIFATFVVGLLISVITAVVLRNKDPQTPQAIDN